jgi:phospho-2-dehydro-3-deoxyheptonate aldolase
MNQLKYGISVTDGCMSWEMTEQLLLESLHTPVTA